ncbi:MAG: DNA primase [bacterium]|nr:DNA primase [bacterium]
MDPVTEIKARLPIDELVGGYCQLKKKGRNFVCVCPFHNDTRPSFLVSPDKGIAYCFACQTGGDVFSFYQAIEGVDFRQAVKDLADRVGIVVADAPSTAIKKDEKDRLRDCLTAALKFYQNTLKQTPVAMEYIAKRLVPEDQVTGFGLGMAPNSFSATYEHLLKEGFSRSEILAAGLGVQKDLQEAKIYDRFRNRLMFPIFDHQGNIVGFGGRTLGEDDAKYINNAEGPLYNKSSILYGLEKAKDTMREAKAVVMVEGYFDVLACHRVGVENVVAVSGTALTEQHVKILKRMCEKVILCLDQDQAGKDAARRAFLLCSEEGIHVHVVALPYKDPDETAAKDPALLKKLLENGGLPYLDAVLEHIKSFDTNSVEGKRDAMKILYPLMESIPTSVEREHYFTKAAGVLQTSETALKEDLERLQQKQIFPTYVEPTSSERQAEKKKHLSATEVVMGIFLLYPTLRSMIEKLLPPDEGFSAVLYEAIKSAPEDLKLFTAETLGLEGEDAERVGILLLYCENHDMSDWSESTAQRELKKNCTVANRNILQHKQKEIAKELAKAKAEGRFGDEAQLSTKYQEVLKLAKMAT